MTFDELKGYLEPFFAETRTSLKGLTDTIQEIKDDLHEIDVDVRRIQKSEAVQDHRITKIEEQHAKDEENKKWGVEMWLLVGALMATVIFDALAMFL